MTPGQQTTPYGVNDVNAPAVWPVTRGKSLANGPAIHVAIIDTGIDYNYSELSGAFKGGFNFVARNGDPLDDNGHGTHVAGIIAAANNGSGVVGVASDVDIYSLKVLDICGSQTKIGISAPREILVLRSEVRLTAEANRLAARHTNPAQFANLARKFNIGSGTHNSLR